MKRLALVLALLAGLGACDDDEDNNNSGGGGGGGQNHIDLIAVPQRSAWHDAKYGLFTPDGRRIGQATFDKMVVVGVLTGLTLLTLRNRKRIS